MVKTRRRRVRFAQGPFSDQYATKDGHPHHEGQTAIQRRSVSSPWPLDLTPHSIRMLEAEVGDICQHSIERLKRRVGLLPLLQRPLKYLTTQYPANSSNNLPDLQPVLSRVRSSQQANMQPSRGTGPQDSTTFRPGTGTKARKINQQVHNPALNPESHQTGTALQHQEPGPSSSSKLCSSAPLNSALSKPVASTADASMTDDDAEVSRVRTSYKASNKSPKKSLSIKLTGSRQSMRSKATRSDR